MLPLLLLLPLLLPQLLLLPLLLLLLRQGYDPVFGARPVKRAVQRELETSLAKMLLRGDFGEDDTVLVDAPPGMDLEGAGGWGGGCWFF